MSTATAPTTPQTAIERYDPSQSGGPILKLRELFIAKRPDLEICYPAAMKSAAARLAQAVVTEVMKSQPLQKCSHLSLLSCAVQAAQLNLEIGGPMGQTYLVPYGTQATLQVGYRGLVTLAHRSRRVASICAVSVRTGDKFKVLQGTNRGIEHDPGTPPGKDVTHVYAIVAYRGGGFDFEVFTKEQINEHRDKFSKEWKSRGQSSVWGQHWEQMALKTVLRRLLKRCPIGVDLGPDEFAGGDGGIETIAEEQLPAAQREQLRQVEENEAAEEAPVVVVGDPEEAFRVAVIAEIDRLAVQVAGSWDAVRKEYGEGFGITCTRARDLGTEQALALRNQLRKDASAKVNHIPGVDDPALDNTTR